VFDEELGRVQEVLRGVAAAGVDAIIVQDSGVVELARRLAPGLPIHGSTQMSITSAEGAQFAARRGVERVVVGREVRRRRGGAPSWGPALGGLQSDLPACSPACLCACAQPARTAGPRFCERLPSRMQSRLTTFDLYCWNHSPTTPPPSSPPSCRCVTSAA
jgi:hypothetical protein